jgi:ribonuclease P/MRP protein subunit POP5
MVRIKHRYLLFNILYPSAASTPSSTNPPSAAALPSYISIHRASPEHLTSRLVLSTLRHNINTIFGDHGLGVTQSSLKIVYFSPATSTCILRCPRAHFRLVWASLTFMDSIPGGRYGEPRTRCVIQVVRVSGTIRKSEEELLRRARRDVVRAKLEGMSEDTALLEGLVGGAGVGMLEKGKGRATEPLLDRNVGEGGIEDFDDGEDEEEAELSDTED